MPPAAEDARKAASTVLRASNSDSFKARTSRMPSTSLAYVATQAAIDAAVMVQSVQRGQFTRATLRSAKEIVLRAISENEDVREKARQSALRAKRETQRELDSRIQNTRRKISELDQAVNYASAKQVKGMRKEAARMRRDLDELKRARFEVEQAKVDVCAKGEMRLGKQLKLETNVACALQTRVVRDSGVSVRLVLSILTQCERADTITQLCERATLQSCGILRGGGERRSQIRGLTSELRSVELQWLMMRQLVRAGMPKWWGLPPSAKHGEKALTCEREKKWCAATAQYSELLLTARKALMAAVDRLLRSCIMRAMYARRRRAAEKRLRAAKAIQLQCASRVWLARRKRDAMSKNSAVVALRELRTRTHRLWARVRASVLVGLRDHAEYAQRRTAVRRIQLTWRFQRFCRQEERRLRASADRQMAAKRIALFWQAGRGKEQKQFGRVRVREAQYQRELKRGRALLRKAVRLHREADESEGATKRRGASTREAIGSPVVSPRLPRPLSPMRRPPAGRPGTMHHPQPPQQARSPSTTARSALSRTKQLSGWEAEAGRLRGREADRSPRSVPPVHPPARVMAGRAAVSPIWSPRLATCACDTARLPSARKTHGGLRVSVRRPGPKLASTPKAGSVASPCLATPEAAAVPEWSGDFDHNGKPTNVPLMSPGLLSPRMPERSSAHGLLTSHAAPAGPAASPRRAREAPSLPPVQQLTSAQHAAAMSIARRVALGYALMEAEFHLLRMAHAEARRREQAALSPASRTQPPSPPQAPVVQTPRARHTMAVADARALWRLVEDPPPNSILAAAESKTWEMVQRYAVPPPPCEAPAIDELDVRIQLFSDSQPDMVSAEMALAQLWKDTRLQATAFKEKREELAKWRDDWRRWTAGCAMRRRLLAAEEAHQARLRAAERARRERMRRWLCEDRAAVVVQSSWRARQRRRTARLLELEANMALLRRKSEMEQREANRRRDAAQREEKARLAREAEAARHAEQEKPVDWASLTLHIFGQLDAALSPFHARKAELDEQDRLRAEEERLRCDEQLHCDDNEGEMLPSPGRKPHVRKSVVSLPLPASMPAAPSIHRIQTPMPPRRVPSVLRPLRGGSSTQLGSFS